MKKPIINKDFGGKIEFEEANPQDIIIDIICLLILAVSVIGIVILPIILR